MKRCKRCGITLDIVLTHISNKEKLTLCMNHFVEFFCTTKNLDFLKDQGTKCFICGDTGIYFKDQDMQEYLCSKHLKDLAMLDLEPEAWKVLIKKYPHAHLLHDDFYSEEGISLQPKK